MARALKLDNEHIVETNFTLPSPDWRISGGYEWFTRRMAYIAFMVHADVETDAYGTIDEAVDAAYTKHRQVRR